MDDFDINPARFKLSLCSSPAFFSNLLLYLWFLSYLHVLFQPSDSPTPVLVDTAVFQKMAFILQSVK